MTEQEIKDLYSNLYEKYVFNHKCFGEGDNHEELYKYYNAQRKLLEKMYPNIDFETAQKAGEQKANQAYDYYMTFK